MLLYQLLNIIQAMQCCCRLHSAGHLLDLCVRNVGWGHLEPSKGYHFPDGYALLWVTLWTFPLLRFSENEIVNMKKSNGLTADCSFSGIQFSLITHLLHNNLLPACFTLVSSGWFYLVRVVCRPYVEYKGAVPQNELQSKQNELQAEANSLITKGGKVCSSTIITEPSLFISLRMMLRRYYKYVPPPHPGVRLHFTLR